MPSARARTSGSEGAAVHSPADIAMQSATDSRRKASLFTPELPQELQGVSESRQGRYAQHEHEPDPIRPDRFAGRAAQAARFLDVPGARGRQHDRLRDFPAAGLAGALRTE